jgi:phosphonate transport system substrate-binding protein
MPQFFMEQRGVRLADLKGAPGFSGSHDKTIELVSAGTFEAGAVNGQVWKSRLADGRIDPSSVVPFWTTPPYHDYHWLLHPSASTRYGDGFADRLRAALLALDPGVAAHREVLDLIGAKRFIAANEGDYGEIEQIGRSTGLIVDGATSR